MGTYKTLSGTVEKLSDRGVSIDGTEYPYSKFFTGPRLEKAAVGTKVTLAINETERGTFIVDPKGQTNAGGKTGKFSSGAPRGRLSPEELELKKAEGPRIARSVAVEHAVVALTHGIDAAKILETAEILERYVLNGRQPKTASGATAPVKPAAPSTPGNPPIATSKVEREKSPAPESSSAAHNAKEDAPVHDSKDAKPAAKAKRACAAEAAATAPRRRVTSKEVNALYDETSKRGWSFKDFQEYAQSAFQKSPYYLTPDEFALFAQAVRVRLGAAA